MQINEHFQAALQADSTHLHLVAVGTKPDIIKQAPVYHALQTKGLNVVVVHTGQHYDFNLSDGMIEELGVEVAVNFEISGSNHEKIAQIWQNVEVIIGKAVAAGKTPIFYVHGDTTTASQIGAASYAARYPVVHIEAGIRAYNPKPEVFKRLLEDVELDWEWYYGALQDATNHEKGSMEPYPEQFNTRTAAATAGLAFAADGLAAKNLKAEGFRETGIHVVGNSIADITRETLAKAESSTIFESYPQLADGFIRFCIHRSENCEHEGRFTALFEMIEHYAETDHTILFILMNKTKASIERYGLQDRLEKLRQKENVVVTDVWPYYTDVIAAMQKATLCVTDSGSMQEEMHLMRIPCVTIRYGTDRPETVLAGSNVIAPPHNKEVLVNVVDGALQNLDALKQPTEELYGTDVSKQVAEIVAKTLENDPSLFQNDQSYLTNALAKIV